MDQRAETGLQYLSKLILLCLASFGFAVVLVLVFALVNSTWRPHCLDLLHRSWNGFQEAEGSSTIGIVSNWVYPVLIVAITLFLVWRQRGWSAVMEHWRREALTALRVTIVVCMIVYGPVLVWQSAKIIFENNDHTLASNETSRAKVLISAAEPHPRGTHGSASGYLNIFYTGVDRTARSLTFRSNVVFKSKMLTDEEVRRQQDKLLQSDEWGPAMQKTRDYEVNAGETAFFSIPDAPGPLREDMKHEWNNIAIGKMFMYVFVAFRYQGDGIPRDRVETTEWCRIYNGRFDVAHFCNGRTRSFLDVLPKGFTPSQ
jgi:hypothetical protein